MDDRIGLKIHLTIDMYRTEYVWPIFYVLVLFQNKGEKEE